MKKSVKKKNVYTFTHYELNEYTKKAARKFVSVFIAAATEEFGWSKDEALRLWDRLVRYMGAIDDGLISLDDVERMIADELGHDIFNEIF